MLGSKAFRALARPGQRFLSETATPVPKVPKPGKWKRRVGFTVGIAALGVGVSIYSHLPIKINPEDYPNRKKVVILGGGWAAVSCLRELDPRLFEVTVVSPRDYFLFTPGLASMVSGVVDARSIAEPLQPITHAYSATYYRAAATSIDPEANVVTCEGPTATFDLPYDELVIAVGSVNNTYNTEGVYEHALFFRGIEDAMAIRRAVVHRFQDHATPTAHPDHALHFVIVGGGPNGVEFAAELHDWIRQDLSKEFGTAADQAKVTLVELMDHILNTYDQRISDYTESHFRRQGVNVLTETKVTAVRPDVIEAVNTITGEAVTLPFGLCVWSTGVGPHPLVQEVRRLFPERQPTERALLANDELRVRGAINIWAIGDCATIEPRIMHNNILDYFREADANNSGDLDRGELLKFVKEHEANHPQLKKITKLISSLDANDRIDLAHFEEILRQADASVTLLPATAQVASQQGTYLGRHLNLRAVGKGMGPFKYKHFASIAYVGNGRAVADFFSTYFVMSGLGAWWLWRSVYLSKQVSWKSRILLSTDHIMAAIWGRHTSSS